MVRYGMVIDIAKCVGCYNCFLACKDEHCGNDYPGYSAAQPMTGQFWIRIIEKEKGKFPKVKLVYIPVLCMHCDNAACIKLGSEAVYKRPDGIIIIDPEKAVGQSRIVSSCPYRVIYWNEEKKLPQKCTLCAHLLDQGYREPRCVESCPTGALVFGDLDDPNSEISRLVSFRKVESLHPEYNLEEKVVYANLSKAKPFIAGSVVYGDTDEWAEGITVKLIGAAEKKETKTNCFGDFEFEGLLENTDYIVEIETPGYKRREFQVKTRTDVYLGEIILPKI